MTQETLPLYAPLAGGATGHKKPNKIRFALGGVAFLFATAAWSLWVYHEPATILSESTASASEFNLYTAAGDAAPKYSRHYAHNVDGQDAHLLLREPTLCDDSVQQYSGYFTVDSNLDKKYFFWFFESRHAPTNSPTTMWLSGGPGASSMLALLVENGPCTVNPDGLSTTINPYSWTESSNMLWVDQPPGTGFSTGAYDTNEVEIGNDMYVFLQSFFRSFPQYNKDFHVTGESYGGHYVPVVSSKIVNENKAINKGDATASNVYIDFKGMAVGNGMTVPDEQLMWYPLMAYNSSTAPSIVSASTYQSMLSSLPGVSESVASCYTQQVTAVANGANAAWSMETLPAECVKAWSLYSMNLLMPVLQLGANQYDLRLKGNYNFSTLDQYLSDPKVVRELGALKKWVAVNIGVWMHLAPSDFLRSNTLQVQNVLASGAKVLVYAGDQDFVCNWLGNKAWTEKLPWSGREKFVHSSTRNFYKPSGAAEDHSSLSIGELKAYSNFAFLRVYEAGHMVPMDQPEGSLYMFEQFLNGNLFG